MNSASYNLNNDTIVTSGFEGRLIKQALQNCASVADFEQMIINMPKPTRLEGNFGVIDASGGAVYFELGNFSYIKYDANNSIDAPNGYLIRTNYSFSGEEDGGGGYIRYVTTNDVFEKAVSNNTLNYCTIIQDGSRNLKNSLTGVDLNTYLNLPENQTTYVTLQDFIPRNGSVSSCVVQGVSPGENPSLTTMWSVVGFPLTSLTIPIFLNKEVDLPVVVKYDSLLKDSPMSHYSLVLKDEVFSFKHGIDKNYYIDVNKVLNADSTGYLQKIIPLENQIIQESEKYITQWKSENKCDNAQLKELYNWIDDKINTFFRTNYNLNHHDVF
jgi:hypothetical protein